MIVTLVTVVPQFQSSGITRYNSAGIRSSIWHDNSGFTRGLSIGSSSKSDQVRRPKLQIWLKCVLLHYTSLTLDLYWDGLTYYFWYTRISRNNQRFTRYVILSHDTSDTISRRSGGCKHFKYQVNCTYNVKIDKLTENVYAKYDPRASVSVCLFLSDTT